jgi:dsDNA-specific endonuclease/ATPase MutS2
MPLADSMRQLVNDLKRQRKARHNAVAGNREIVRQMTEENRAFLASIHDRNRQTADQTKQMLSSSAAARKEEFDSLMKNMRADLDRIHQAKEAIVQGAKATIKEHRDDHEMARSYWSQVGTDDLIGEDPVVAKQEPAAASEMPASNAAASSSSKQPKPIAKKRKTPAKKIKPVTDNPLTENHLGDTGDSVADVADVTQQALAKQPDQDGLSE